MRVKDYYTLLCIAVLIFIYCVVLYFVASSTIAIVGAIVTTAGILFALFKNVILKIFFHPDIEIIDHRSTLQTPWPGMNSQPKGITRLLVKNNGWDTAYDVEIQITNVIDPDGITRPDFLPVPLSWTHDGRPRRKLLINQSAYVDMCIKDKTLQSPKFMLAAGQGVFNYEVICNGKTKIELIIIERNGTKRYEIVIENNPINNLIRVISISKLD